MFTSASPGSAEKETQQSDEGANTGITPGRKVQTRIYRACIHCRQRKSKCDLLAPLLETSSIWLILEFSEIVLVNQESLLAAGVFGNSENASLLVPEGAVAE